MPGTVVVNQPGVYLVDADGNVATANDGTTIASHEGLLVAGKDGTVLRFMRVAADGTLRIDPTGTTTQPISAASLPLPTGAATEAKLEAVRVLIASLDGKDYATQTTLATLATEAKLEAVRVLLASLDGKDYATQATLAAILVDTGQIEALLTTIDADTSIISAVQFASINSVNRLETQAALTGRTLSAGAEKRVTVIDDIDDANAKRLQVESQLAPGAKVSIVPVTSASQEPIRDFLKNGASSDMVVDGSVTAQDFVFLADATKAIHLTELRLVFSAFQFDWSGAVGKGGGLLSNGIIIDGIVDNGVAVTFQVIVRNEEFLLLPQRSGVVVEQGGNRDVLAVSIDFGGVTMLEAGTADKIRVRIQDDLTTGARDVNFFKAILTGLREV